MVEDPPTGGPQSLVGIEVRRSFVMGRVYLIVGFAYTLVFETIFVLTGGPTFSTTVPLLLPIFAVVGGMGALSVFTSDRIKGVLEYLMAYGITPRRIFLDILGAGMVLVTLILGVNLVYGVGLWVARTHALPVPFLELALVYTVPMSYVSVAFATTVGMYWTALSSPRAGMGGPIGLIPLIGILPSVLMLAALGVIPGSRLEVLGAGVLVFVLVVVVLLRSMDRLLPRERLLSPA